MSAVHIFQLAALKHPCNSGCACRQVHLVRSGPGIQLRKRSCNKSSESFLFPLFSCPTFGFLFPLFSNSCPPLCPYSCPTFGFSFRLCSHSSHPLKEPILFPLFGSCSHFVPHSFPTFWCSCSYFVSILVSLLGLFLFLSPTFVPFLSHFVPTGNKWQQEGPEWDQNWDQNRNKVGTITYVRVLVSALFPFWPDFWVLVPI